MKRGLTGDWKGYKELWMGCSGCELWQSVRVKEEFDEKQTGEFFCGLCAGVKISALQQNLKKLEAIIPIQKKLEEVAKDLDEVRKGAVIESAQLLEREAESRKSYSEAIAGMREDIASGMVKVSKVVEEVEAVKKKTEEEEKKKRMMVFGLKTVSSEAKVKIEDILRFMRLSFKPTHVRQFSGRGRPEGWVAPIVVEFQSEFERNQVLERKASLNDDVEYKKIFLERDMSVEEREEKKKRWVLRGLSLRKRKVLRSQEGTDPEGTPEMVKEAHQSTRNPEVQGESKEEEVQVVVSEEGESC